jgi:hypothetical protein
MVVAKSKLTNLCNGDLYVHIGPSALGVIRDWLDFQPKKKTEFSREESSFATELGSKSLEDLILVAAETRDTKPRVDKFYFHVQVSNEHSRRKTFIRVMVSDKLEFNGRLGIHLMLSASFQ